MRFTCMKFCPARFRNACWKASFDLLLFIDRDILYTNPTAFYKRRQLRFWYHILVTMRKGQMRMKKTRWFSVVLAVVAATGAAADGTGQKGGFRLLLDVGGALSVATTGQRVTAVVSNASPASVDWRVRIEGNETFGGTFAVPEFRCTLPSGAVQRIELPPAPVKGWYCFAMLAGRLEIYTMVLLAARAVASVARLFAKGK